MLIAPVDLKTSPLPFYQAVADAIRELQHPGKPVNVAGVRRTDLPPAADWPNGVLRVSDLDILAVSNGAAWIRQDTGGPI